MMIQALLS